LGPFTVCDETNLISRSRRTRDEKIEHEVDATRDEPDKCAAPLAWPRPLSATLMLRSAKVDAAREELDKGAAPLAGHGH
jgi:hypothetical protein